MEVLYISSCCSDSKYKELFELSSGKLHHSINNFHLPIIKGLKKNNLNVSAFCGLQISNKNTLKKIFKSEESYEDDILYIYPFIINIPILKNIFTIISLIINYIKWVIKNKKNKKIIFVDASYVSLTPLVVFLSKLIKIKTVSIVADIYDYMSLDVEKDKPRNILKKVSCFLCNYSFNNYDYFVLLTEQMSKIVNKNNKPYVVMEGIINSDKYTIKTSKNNNKKVILYTGSIYEKFGLKNLINAFTKIDRNCELHLYGNTDMDNYLEKMMNKDKRIKYFGNISHQEIVEKQQAAYILVNPRPTNEEYTKYSFPSKTLEYMLSGNIFVTTKLKGIPKEYDEYLNYFDSYKEKDIQKKLEELLDEKNKKELKQKALKAKKFVLDNKNYLYQTSQIINLIKEEI